MNENNVNERGSWGSNIGFLLSAIGSAVGLGNIWGFPYKMGKCGGLTFLLVYLGLAIFVGLPIMLAELSLGRNTGCGPVNAYKRISQKFKWVGWLAVIAPFLIMTFYSVLGGYCIWYIIINLIGIFAGGPAGSASFGAMLTSPIGQIGVMILFMLICWLINMGGVAGGIEKFNKVGMPALAIMLVIIIIRAWTLPNAGEGLKFMFVPGYAVKAGFIEKTPSLISILAIFVIILLVQKSITLPILLVAVIELAIAANLCIPYYTGVSLPFVGPILISTIQLGATVDYAILMTTRYKQNRHSGKEKKEAIEKAVASSAQSILVSGIGFFAATYGVGIYSNVDIISSMCRLIARGALLSVAVVLLLLPAVLLLLDNIIVHTTFDMKSVR